MHVSQGLLDKNNVSYGQLRVSCVHGYPCISAQYPTGFFQSLLLNLIDINEVLLRIGYIIHAKEIYNL